MPSERHQSLLPTPIAFGHRGARAHAAENTLASFRLAVEMGATGLESDVWVTADGVPVLDHDGLIRRRWRAATPIGLLRRSQLPEHIPSLAEFYDALGTELPVSLDLKDESAGRAVIEAARNAGGSALEQLWLCAPRRDTLRQLRGCGPRLVSSTTLRAMKDGPERRAAELQRDGIDCLNMHHSEWTPGLVVLLHKFGRFAFSWDMQDPLILARGLRMGVDGVYSDWVDRMVAAFAGDALGG